MGQFMWVARVLGQALDKRLFQGVPKRPQTPSTSDSYFCPSGIYFLFFWKEKVPLPEEEEGMRPPGTPWNRLNWNSAWVSFAYAFKFDL